ncbi:MAG: nucleoside monophosphate kinase [Patescibacteria group bacterium]|nr:nucleoside monophosphate kinase [Patescibacteria group bacterium]
MKSTKKQVIIFMGPPGSGKGTQTDMLAERLKIPAISAGELLRLEMKNKTKIGEAIRKGMDRGTLAPDKMVREIMEKRLKKSDTKNGFILDGFPRHYKQTRDLEEILSEFHESEKNVSVFYIYISPAEARRRLGKRRVCIACGRTYHLDINPPKKKGICDNCGHQIERRKDDEPSAVNRRLRNFHRENDPLLDYFSAQNILFRINGEQGIAKVQQDILKDIKSHNT